MAPNFVGVPPAFVNTLSLSGTWPTGVSARPPMSSRLTDRTGASAGTDRTGTERTGTDRTGAPSKSAASSVLVDVTPGVAHTSDPCEVNHAHQFWKFVLVLGALGGAAIGSWFSVDAPRNTDASVMSRNGVCDRSIWPSVGPRRPAAARASRACTSVMFA